MMVLISLTYPISMIYLKNPIVRIILSIGDLVEVGSELTAMDESLMT